MIELHALVRDYCDLLDQEQRLAERKEALRRQILQHLDAEGLAGARTSLATAQRASRFKLTPRRDEVLGLLDRDDLFAFAQFTPAKVKAVLVPKYGRERLQPLFDIEKSEYLYIRRERGRRPVASSGPAPDEPSWGGAVSPDDL